MGETIGRREAEIAKIIGAGRATNHNPNELAERADEVSGVTTNGIATKTATHAPEVPVMRLIISIVLALASVACFVLAYQRRNNWKINKLERELGAV